MSWYYIQNGNQCGPVTEQALAGKVKNGELQASDLVWQEGMADWKPVNQFPQFGAGAVAAAPATIATNPSFAQPAAAAAGYQKIPNYLWQSIAATVLCCVPFGIVAIVYAAKVDGLVARGDIAGAQAASKSARTWVNVSVGVGLLVAVAYIGLMLLGAASGGMQ